MINQVTVENGSGLHARPASILVSEASKFDCDIFVEFNGNRVNAKSILGLMSLGIGKGSEISIITEGVDEETALSTLCELVRSGLGE